MVKLIENIPEVEMSMMDNYVKDYACYNHAPMEKILRYWDMAKSQYLYKMLGNQFRVSKEFEYKKSSNTLRKGLLNKFDDRTSACARVRKLFDRFLWDNRITLGDNYYKLQKLMDIDVLIDQSYDYDEFSVNTPDGKVIKIQKGCRPLRMIARIVKAYGGMDLIDEFQTEVSMAINQKLLKGTMTLSIHPLDYMTMSDNWSDWSSCMSWMDEGCYRRGTVEMMNSNCVVVAYLSSDRNMELVDLDGQKHDWNNKKWRELFIVTPQVISGVKGYPYQNDDLVKSVNLWIKELAETNLGWKYCDENTAFQHRTNFNYKGTDNEMHQMKLAFETYTMYNDFGSIDRHWCIMGEENVIDSDALYINYSGEEVCMQCGCTGGEFDGEGALVCMDCDGGSCYYCDCCGERLYEDEAYELDGNYYCEHCYNDLCETDVLTEDCHSRDNMYFVQLVPEGFNPEEIWRGTGEGRYMYEPNKYNWAWNQVINELERPREVTNHRPTGYGWDDHRTFMYLYPSDFKDVQTALEYYELSSLEDLG